MPSPTEIINSITSVASFALESQKDVTVKCLEALHEMTLRMIKRDKLGYDVARDAARIGVIGAIALSKNESFIADKAAELLANFNENYLRDSPSPHDNKQIEEMQQLHKNLFTNLMTSSEPRMFGTLYKTIQPNTIEEFIKLYEQKRKKTTN